MWYYWSRNKKLSVLHSDWQILSNQRILIAHWQTCWSEVDQTICWELSWFLFFQNRCFPKSSRIYSSNSKECKHGNLFWSWWALLVENWMICSSESGWYFCSNARSVFVKICIRPLLCFRECVYGIKNNYRKPAATLVFDKGALEWLAIWAKHVTYPANHRNENTSAFRKVDLFIY